MPVVSEHIYIFKAAGNQYAIIQKKYFYCIHVNLKLVAQITPLTQKQDLKHLVLCKKYLEVSIEQFAKNENLVKHVLGYFIHLVK